MWKEIRKDWVTLLDNPRFLIGNGCVVKFWKDSWCGEEALCTAFPTLFSLVVHKDVLVRDVWDNSEEGGVWNPCFTRSFNDWKVREVESFLLTIQPSKIISSREDKLILKGNIVGIYSMKLMYEELNRTASSPMTFLVQSVWNPLVPLKVGFFAWEAVWGKVLTLDQLKRRVRPLANRCYLCENEKETIDHLLVHCQHDRLLWEIILATVGMG